MVPILKSNDLMGFVDGSKPCISKFLLDDQGKLTSDINLLYMLWHKKDQFVLGWINATLSNTMAPYVFGLTTASHAWTALEKKFASNSQSHVSHLKCKLQSLTQGSRSCWIYLDETREIAAKLGATRKTVDDDELITYVTYGLNPIYLPFMTSLSLATRDNPLLFDDFQIELLSNELFLESQFKNTCTETNHFALFASKPPSNSFNRKLKYSQNRPNLHSQVHWNFIPHLKPPSNPIPANHLYNTPKPLPNITSLHSSCQICGKSSHQAMDCFHRIDYAYQGRHPPAQFAAMVAHTNSKHEIETWFDDSRVIQHITTNLEQLTLAQPYTGREDVAVSNG